MLDGPCNYLGAYKDVERAQHALHMFVDAFRRRVAPQIVMTQLKSLSEGDVKYLPIVMMEYLLTHLDAYTKQV